jgi:hypothetical protein
VGVSVAYIDGPHIYYVTCMEEVCDDIVQYPFLFLS